jgi:hypothetical protein
MSDLLLLTRMEEILCERLKQLIAETEAAIAARAEATA